MRIAAAVVVLVLSGIGLGAGGGTTAGPGSLYLAQPDARLCPSPLCGGWILRRVNHALTRCLDGSLQRSCYVAELRGLAAPPAGSLVEGTLVAAGLPDFPGLAALKVGRGWRPVAGTPAPGGTTYRARDNGVRCITAPCFSYDAVVVERASTKRLSEVDLSRVGLTASGLSRARRALAGAGLLVSGRIVVVPRQGPAGSGRTLVAGQVWLAAG